MPASLRVADIEIIRPLEPNAALARSDRATGASARPTRSESTSSATASAGRSIEREPEAGARLRAPRPPHPPPPRGLRVGEDRACPPARPRPPARARRRASSRLPRTFDARQARVSVDAVSEPRASDRRARRPSSDRTNRRSRTRRASTMRYQPNDGEVALLEEAEERLDRDDRGDEADDESDRERRKFPASAE